MPMTLKDLTSELLAPHLRELMRRHPQLGYAIEPHFSCASDGPRPRLAGVDPTSGNDAGGRRFITADVVDVGDVVDVASLITIHRDVADDEWQRLVDRETTVDGFMPSAFAEGTPAWRLHVLLPAADERRADVVLVFSHALGDGVSVLVLGRELARIVSFNLRGLCVVVLHAACLSA